MNLSKIITLQTSSICIAINGVQKDIYGKLSSLFSNSSKYIQINLNAESFFDKNFMIREFSKIDSAYFKFLNECNIEDTIDIFKEIDRSYIDKYKIFFIIDLTSCSYDIITQIFSSIRDISYLSVLKSNFKLILMGNWPHQEIKSKIEKLGCSYPFLKKRDEFYLSQLHFITNDCDLLKYHFSNITQKRWDNILDYTNGEVCSTFFVLQNLLDIDNEPGCPEAFFANLCYSYFRAYLDENNVYAEIQKRICDRFILNSVIIERESGEDLFFRSNLFSSKIGQSGDRVIFTPNNYFCEYILYQMINGTEESYLPTPALTKTRTIIYNEINKYELSIKQGLRMLDKMITKNVIINLPLHLKINTKKHNITSAYDIFLKQTKKDDIYWKDENKPQDFLSVLTFGNITTLFQQLDNTYFIDKSSLFKTNEDIIVINQDGIEVKRIRELNLLTGDHFSLKMSRKCFVRVLRGGEILLDILLSKTSCESLLKQSFCTQILKCKQITIKIDFLKNYDAIKQLLNELLGYRNALAHMKDISQDAINKYEYLKKELFTKMAFRITE